MWHGMVEPSGCGCANAVGLSLILDQGQLLVDVRCAVVERQVRDNYYRAEPNDVIDPSLPLPSSMPRRHTVRPLSTAAAVPSARYKNNTKPGL